MSAAQRRCQRLLLQSIANGINTQLQLNPSIPIRLTSAVSSNGVLPIVSLVPQQSWLHSWLGNCNVSQSSLLNDRLINGQGLYPRLVHQSLSHHTGDADGKDVPKHAQQPRTAKKPFVSGVQAFHDAGWTREAVLNVPNAISMARLISGPFVAYFILQEHWATALGLLGVAGASDWADGYAAKHYGQSSVLGSYLDPLADKVLVCCTVWALAQQGSLPTALAGIIIGRDMLLVTGAFVDRVRKVGGKCVGWAEFFRLSANTASAETESAHTGADSSASAQTQHEGSDGSGVSRVPPVAPAAFVQPLYISKVNTVFQLCLVAGCIGRSWYGWPTEDMLWALGGITGLTTLASLVAYLRIYRQGKLLSS